MNKILKEALLQTRGLNIMSPETTVAPINQTQEVVDWQPTMPPTDLIFDDGEPLESNRHRITMNVLIRSVQQALAQRNDFFVGGNMFIYYSSTQARNKDFKGPDFFVVLDIDGSYAREAWIVWEENGRYPDIIIELLSESTQGVDKGTKKDLYEKTFRTPDYFIYDPFNSNSLQGWHLNSNRKYQAIAPDSRGWLWCETLGFYLGTWEGAIDRDTGVWLRFFDEDGNLVLLPEEAATLYAEQESQRAEQESQRAEQESQRAEQESQRAERLAARLREMGVDPDNL
jgi:Uma2 family endonuclease